MPKYAINRFRESDARAWNGRTVNLTTHPEDGAPARTYERLQFAHIAGRAYAMLGTMNGGEFTLVASVFLHQIANIEAA